MSALGNKRKRPEIKNKKKQYEKQDEIDDKKEGEKKIISSIEGFQKSKILEFTDVSEFNSLLRLSPPDPNLSLFETKKYAELYFQEKKYNTEDLLEYDNTNANIQKKYLSIAVNQLNKNPKEDIKNILIEKIQKSGIILKKNDYEDEIKKIKNKDLNEKLEYVDYKQSIIKCLQYIKNNKNGNVNEARKILNIIKFFYFNHESTFGDNNYYYYGLAEELSKKLEEIFRRYHFYLYIIEKNLEYLTRVFSELTKNDKYKFKFLNNILVDDNSIKKQKTYDEIKNYLEGNPVDDTKKLEKNIKERNKKESNKESEYLQNIEHIEYKLAFNNSVIEYIINEKTKFDRKYFSRQYIRKHKFQNFNSQIIEMIKGVSLDNFEEEIYKHILPDCNLSDSFYEDDKKIIYKIITNILQSNAAKKFFKKNYENKYSKYTNNKIVYHFHRPDVINEILNRIEFYPIFTPTINAFTSASDLTIVINSIPGRFDEYDEINYFNKRILQIGRIVVFLINEIFGNFLRRYYSYLTNGIIKMNTKEDDLIDSKPEGGDYIKINFLGINTHARLYLKDTLFLLFYDNNFENYPLVKKNKEITEEILEKIIRDNPEVFDFIEVEKNIKEDGKSMNEEKKVEKMEEENDEKKQEEEIFNINEKKDKKKENVFDKITMKQYINYLNPEGKGFTSIISCGFRSDEQYIELIPKYF